MSAKRIPVLQGQEINYEDVRIVNLLAKRGKKQTKLDPDSPLDPYTQVGFFFLSSFKIILSVLGIELRDSHKLSYIANPNICF